VPCYLDFEDSWPRAFLLAGPFEAQGKQKPGFYKILPAGNVSLEEGACLGRGYFWIRKKRGSIIMWSLLGSGLGVSLAKTDPVLKGSGVELSLRMRPAE
jgi:hypothetical protein